jgi:ElaB/YqjD/DUF883 family membrane-anchored ribosome-binding protein
MSKDYEQRRDELMNDVRSVLDEAESLYNNAVEDGTEKGRELRQLLSVKLDTAKRKFTALEESVVDKAKYAAKQTDELIQEKPYHAIGIAAAVGVVVGLLLGRSGR